MPSNSVINVHSCYNILRRSSPRKFVFAILLLISLVSFICFESLTTPSNDISNYNKKLHVDSEIFYHSTLVDNYYQKRKNWSTSNLGSILYKNINSEVFVHKSRRNRTFAILIWKYYDWLRQRHINNFRDSKENRSVDPLDSCSVKNCLFYKDDKMINEVDAVVIHMQHGIIPEVRNRNPNQRWVFLSDESPSNTFSMAKNMNITLSSLENIFNWTMTYRSDSDIPVPYGRTAALSNSLHSELSYGKLPELVPNWSMKQRITSSSILISHCTNSRMNFLKRLKQYLNVDVYGKCGVDKFQKSCPGHFKADCGVLSKYLFYLALENSSCRQYFTEKIFYNAYSKGAIPIIAGPSLEECEEFLPPNSYIHVNNYKNIEELATDIIRITESDEKLFYYHKWRNHFMVSNEHGFFGSKSFHFCRICEALNYNDGDVSVYDENDLNIFFDKNINCDSNYKVIK